MCLIVVLCIHNCQSFVGADTSIPCNCLCICHGILLFERRGSLGIGNVVVQKIFPILGFLGS